MPRDKARLLQAIDDCCDTPGRQTRHLGKLARSHVSIRGYTFEALEIRAVNPPGAAPSSDGKARSSCSLPSWPWLRRRAKQLGFPLAPLPQALGCHPHVDRRTAKAATARETQRQMPYSALPCPGVIDWISARHRHPLPAVASWLERTDDAGLRAEGGIPYSAQQWRSGQFVSQDKVRSHFGVNAFPDGCGPRLCDVLVTQIT